MMLICYPITAFEGQEQFINHPNKSLNMFDTTNKEESMKAFLVLLAQFGKSLQYYNMSSRSSDTFFENIDNLFDDINSQEIDFEGLWCVLLNLEEEDVRKVLDGYKRDFVIVDGKTHKPLIFSGEDKKDMVVYGDFEFAYGDMMAAQDNEGDTLYCLLSLKNQEADGKCDVHIFQMKFEDVKEIGTFASSHIDNNEWFENSYDALVETLMPKKKMYLLQCQYANGGHFEGSTYNELFTSQDDAMLALREEADNIEAEFEKNFGEDSYKEEDRGDFIEIQYHEYEDCWTGQVIELEVN